MISRAIRLATALAMMAVEPVETGQAAPAEASVADPETEEAAHEESSCQVSCPAPEPMVEMVATAPVMYVWPEPGNDDLLELTLRAIERVQLRTGARIEISESGIPIRINDADSAQARAVTDKWCAGGDCTASHAHIGIRTDTVERIYVDSFADNSLAHEFAHVLSGWGHCSTEDVDGHLEPGHIISNGNTGYGQMSWTEADTRLACSCGAC